MEDTIIVGGGPAALTAAIYLGRYLRKVVLLAETFGGQAATAGIIENYPGIKSIDGVRLINQMVEQARETGVNLLGGEKVDKIEKVSGGFQIETKNKTYEAKTILIAAGKNPRKLGLEGEEILIGKGLSYCATCDGPFAKDKDVVLIGGGNAASKSALVVTKYARTVTILNINEKLVSESVTLEKIKKDPKITVINYAQSSGFKTENGFISAVEYTKDGSKKTVPAKMVFVEIGQIPSTDNFKDLVDLSEKGEIKINSKNETSLRGIYAAGDITEIEVKQIIVAAGEGAKASIHLNSYLEEMG